MSLSILTLTLGQLENNTYLAADPITRQAVVIDPSFEAQAVLDAAQAQGWQITAIWLTHAHFDHIAGIATITAALPAVKVGLHPGDMDLWHAGGGARLFGFSIEQTPEPTLSFTHDQQLALGGERIEVRHTPGHSPGHVVFYAPQDHVVFCGDLIFEHSVGRTDLPGSSHQLLLQSIRQQIFTLPGNTRLLPGHGPATSVGKEQVENPFL